ncbi:DnaJ-domain-containing protein [Ascobolus immersus RN42]|uniref:DnaJ-domain-containing protein n=1 Tax=Ascobolus immersus RN42 TaxID=1160509 RepID=A0A3N4HXM6_ASCIM|nr:DnaJ-domain-containing protein [Ascobolus immersus RN42]
MSTILNVLLWTFLPSVATSIIQRGAYSTGILPPPQSKERARTHYRIINALIILGYLLYTLYIANLESLQEPPNFYQILGLPYTFSNDQQLRSVYRKLSVKYHPDKVGMAGAEQFVLIKTAYETLGNPAKRFAYDRWGPQVLEWKGLETLAEYVEAGLKGVIKFYVGYGLGLVGLGVLRRMSGQKFWRFFAFSLLLTFEFATVTRPTSVLPAGAYYRPLLQFEQISLARKFMVTVFMAFSQLGPLVSTQQHTSTKIDETALRVATANATALMEEAEKHTNTLLAGYMVPFKKRWEDVVMLEKKLGRSHYEAWCQEQIDAAWKLEAERKAEEKKDE